MILTIATISIIISFFADWYLYKKVFSKTHSPKKWRTIYLSVIGVVYLFFFACLCMFSVVPVEHAEVYTRVFMWSVYFLILTTAPKINIVMVFVISSYIEKVRGKKVQILRKIGLGLAILNVLMLIYAATYGRSSIKVKEVTVESAKVTEAFDGYRIVMFTDLHVGTLVGKHSMISDMVDVINEQEADLVLNMGDLVNQSGFELTPKVLSMFGEINSKDGVWSIMGNHDLGVYYPDKTSLTIDEHIQMVIDKTETVGWKWLIDESTTIVRGGDTISLSGHDYSREFQGHGRILEIDGLNLDRVYRGVDSTQFNITMMHNPMMWDMVLDNGIGDLSLAGHVHAMQIKLNIGDISISPAQLLYERWSGMYEERGKRLYISDGIGTVLFPMRIGVRPEIVVIELKKE